MIDIRSEGRKAFLLETEQTSSLVRCSHLFGRSKLLRLDDSLSLPFISEAVVTIGAFDGVHRGHRFLFDSMISDAAARRMASVIVTFDPDPDELFLPREKVHKLLDNEDRLQYLRSFGADYVLSVSFTRALAAYSATDFVDKVLGSVFKVRGIHVGADFKLGAGNGGDVAALRAHGSSKSRKDRFTVRPYGLLCAGSAPVCATRVRKLLMEQGDCDSSRELLTRCHFVKGRVARGRQMGRTFGFPTANVELSYPYVLPAEGVYAALTLVDGVAWPTAVNVGVPRTFRDEENCGYIEAHLVGFDGDIYDKDVAVAFYHQLRGQRTFPTQQELIDTVMGNIDWVRRNMGAKGVRLD